MFLGYIDICDHFHHLFKYVLTPDFIWKGKKISYNELTSEIPGFGYVSWKGSMT